MTYQVCTFCGHPIEYQQPPLTRHPDCQKIYQQSVIPEVAR